MKSLKSKDVKCAIFETLSEEPRFQHILKTVTDCIKRGQEPVVLENWNSYFRKLKPNDPFWENILTEAEFTHLAPFWDDKDVEMKSRVSLNAKSDTPFREASVSITFSRGDKTLFKTQFNAPEWLMKSQVYFGYRDHNYFRIFFKSLGYHVEDGNVADRQGLLIRLGDE